MRQPSNTAGEANKCGIAVQMIGVGRTNYTLPLASGALCANAGTSALPPGGSVCVGVEAPCRAPGREGPALLA